MEIIILGLIVLGLFLWSGRKAKAVPKVPDSGIPPSLVIPEYTEDGRMLLRDLKGEATIYPIDTKLIPTSIGTVPVSPECVATTTPEILTTYLQYMALDPSLPKPSTAEEWTGFYPTQATINQIEARLK